MWSNTIAFYIFSKRVEKIKLEKSHKGKRHIFSFGIIILNSDFNNLLKQKYTKVNQSNIKLINLIKSNFLFSSK
jgi:hypothetical protein